MISEPKTYLGAYIRKYTFSDNKNQDVEWWAIGSESYTKKAIKTVERLRKKHNLKLPSTRRHGKNSPVSNVDYKPELDYSDMCNEELFTVYLNLKGV